MYRSMVGKIAHLDQRQYTRKVKRLKMGTEVQGWMTNTFVTTRSDCGSGTYCSVPREKANSVKESVLVEGTYSAKGIGLSCAEIPQVDPQSCL